MIFKIFKSIQLKRRYKLIDEVNEKYDNKLSGVSGLLSALSDFRDSVIVLFRGKEILGAVSYYIPKGGMYLEVDHIGVVEQRCGYGTLLMRKIFEIAGNKYPVTLVTNGYSNIFYEKLGMYRINDKLPAIYEYKNY